MEVILWTERGEFEMENVPISGPQEGSQGELLISLITRWNPH